MADAYESDYRCIAEAPLEIRKRLLSCVLWVVKNMQRKVLQQWWTLETQKRVISFFMLLSNSLNTFEYKASASSVSVATKVHVSSAFLNEMKRKIPPPICNSFLSHVYNPLIGFEFYF